ncbi:MAG: thioredoxin family protein [Proteobacteria bacterium]|nr:thioredoxin family protein [Pseudomonadota bacterium]
MAVTPSNMLPLGTQAPDFLLPDVVTSKNYKLSEQPISKATVIAFICNHCPYVKHLLPFWVSFVRTYQAKGISFIAISSNDVENYPEDSPEKMKELALSEKFTFPYLYDETQSVAKAYEAACTPDFYVFDSQMKCVYRGQFDDSRPQSTVQVSGESLASALDAILNQAPMNPSQKPSVGCNIKWKNQ